MPITLKCAACGYEAPFEDSSMEAEVICPGCEVLLRRRSEHDTMAIPVSMALPDEFEPANLRDVPKQSIEQVHRYNKQSSHKVIKTGDPLADSNLILAQAIEQLASAIDQRGPETLSPQEYSIASAVNEIEEPNPHSGEEIPVLNGAHPSEEGEEVKEAGDDRAEPIGSPVLVRREAAAQAHRFQRKAQIATDIKGGKQSGLTRWVESHPLFMMMMGLILVLALVVLTWIVMNDSFTEPDPTKVLASTMAGETRLDDPDIRNAEREARGFLNSVALNPAKPYIFRASAINNKLEKFFEPLSDPANFDFKLTNSQKFDNKTVYYYQVTCGDVVQPLVVLQEDSLFKVFWEFGACIGDLSWRAFLRDSPKEPVLMRAFLTPNQAFDSVHSKEKWNSWLAENWDGSESARFYSKIGSPEDRRLKAALENHPVVRKNKSWVMAQVRVEYVGVGLDSEAGSFKSASITEVPLGSWLPKEFVQGNTFYHERDQIKGSTKEIRGLQRVKEL